ncbi:MULTISPECIES: hypothetical protein [Delftia]|uniref:Uncharacterized protein n=2 Tax=Delftia TaxID=80865 RepID=A0A7T2RZT9_DELAC|nr:hypothetical protein [Delftia acidovorans]QPS06333.1 hypothetical protein I6G66_18670 [Delftia acidovorans]
MQSDSIENSAIQRSPLRPPDITSLAALSLLVALLFSLRPYNGIRHDSILYFGQALRVLFPQELDRDLFFAYGSQASYTIYPKLLAIPLKFFETGAVSMAGLSIAFILFLASSAFFATKILPNRKIALWALIFLLVWPSSYGGYNVFRFQEPYLTSRSYAEPLVIFAMATLILGHRWISLSLLACAALLHPLQALPGISLWLLSQIINKKERGIFAVLIGIILLIFGWMGLHPFNRIFESYDTQWLEAISDVNKNVFMLRWPAESWLWLIIDFFIIFVALPFMQPALRKWSVLALWTTAISCVASILLVDLLKLVLPAGLQLWRAHWLLHWAALVSTPLAIIGMRDQGKSQQPRLVLFSATIVAAAPYGALASVHAAIFTIPLYFAWPHIQKKISRPYVLALYIGLAAAITGTYLRYVAYLLDISNPNLQEIRWERLGLALTHPVVLITIIFFALKYWHRKESIRPYIFGATAALAVASFINWDQRSPLATQIEKSKNPDKIFNYSIEPGATVYWSGQLLAPWVMLHKPSYWNELQQAGLLFNRGTALESQRRANLLYPYQFQSELCKMMDNLNKKPGICQIDVESLKDACHDKYFKLDYLIIPNTLPITPLGKAYMQNDEKNKNESTMSGEYLYLYACKDI